MAQPKCTDWVVLQLSSKGEEEDPDKLRNGFKRTLKGAEVFVPASVSIRGDSRVVHKLVEGYVFVRRTLPDAFFLRLEQTRFVDSVLTHPGPGRHRVLSVISDKEIEKMRAQASIETEQGIAVGDTVLITSGPYRGLQGEVLEDIHEKDTVQVYIQLLSKDSLVELPKGFLRYVAKEGTGNPVFSPFATKATKVREWAKLALGILSPDLSNLELMRTKFADLVAKDSYCEEYLQRTAFLDTFKKEFSRQFKSLNFQTGKAMKRALQLDTWVANLDYVDTLEQAVEGSSKLDLEALVTSQGKVRLLDALLSKLCKIEKGTHKLERDINIAPESMDNVIIDGMNLAHRVFHALDNLSDTSGTATEVIYGFLKSLAAIRKRFSSAGFYVVWDGSDQRRKAIFSDYKAGRTNRQDLKDQVEVLKKILPVLGVSQVCNQDEEADDVVGSLVKGPLAGKHNLIISNDRDFLQLVGSNTIVLVPKVGARAEVFFDAEKVIDQWGVPPSKMVELRALTGDSSDNLKGIPTVDRKLLTALLVTHGSIDGVYASNLAGLTGKQYTKVRAAEATVRRNLGMMSLICDLPFEITEPKPSLEEATSALTALSIQADLITPPFFQDPPTGFFKKS